MLGVKTDGPTTWPEVTLGEICEFKYGKSLPEADASRG